MAHLGHHGSAVNPGCEWMQRACLSLHTLLPHLLAYLPHVCVIDGLEGERRQALLGLQRNSSR